MGGGGVVPFYCLHCGHAAPQVYKTYANGNLVKLLNCRRCGELVDKYVEYDNIILVLNLILLNPMAYRHLLLNTPFLGFWKLGVVSLFVEAYCFWCLQKQGEEDFYELEVNFYTALLRTFFATGIFHLSVLLTTFLPFLSRQIREASGNLSLSFHPPHSSNPDTPASSPTAKRKSLSRETGSLGSLGSGPFSLLTLWKGLHLSASAQVFKLVALIWSYSNDYKRIFLVELLYLFSNAQCYYVTTGLSYWASLLVICTCFALNKYVLVWYDSILS